MISLRTRILAAALALPACHAEVRDQAVSCYDPKGAACLPRDEAKPLLYGPSSGTCKRTAVKSVDDGPVVSTHPPSCCYLVTASIDPYESGQPCGRPLLLGDRARVAKIARRRDWS